MIGLQQHLQAQRESAYRLIERHNQWLASMMGQMTIDPTIEQATLPASVESTVTQPVAQQASEAPSATSRAVAAQPGNVISLFAYRDIGSTADTASNAADETRPEKSSYAPLSEDSAGCFVFNENDPVGREKFGQTIDELLNVYGGDDSLAINRKEMADTIFMVSTKDAIFYHKRAEGVMFVTGYVGPEDRYVDALTQIKNNAEASDLIINIMVQEVRVKQLQENGFSTTPIGIWQRIEPLADFTLAGSKMRRLRYLVGKYKKLGDCKTIEYMPGEDPDVDKNICQVMDQWMELKEANPPFVATVQKQIMAGELGSDHRFFLTYRDASLDNVIVLSRDNLNDGYLMDLEFYAKNMPLGSTEFALSEIIACFQKEGRKVLSLGLTMGTGLFEHDNHSQEVYDLFASLKKAEYLDGDANAQYKNKYRPVSVSMYIARIHGSGRKKLNDLMMILGTG